MLDPETAAALSGSRTSVPAFTAFWTTLVFELETPPYHYGSQAAGLFGLVGAVGATVAPLAGWIADRRTPRFVVAHAIAVVFASFVVFGAWGRTCGAWWSESFC